MEQTTLYYRQGSSDKVYWTAIEEKGGGFTVQFAYGRRGSTLQSGSKTNSPLPYAKAKELYDRVIGEKVAKGYTPGANGTPYQSSDKAERNTGILPMLLNPIDAATAARLIVDPEWWIQEKFDGKRMLIQKTNSGVEGINRNGLTVGIPESIANSASQMRETFTLDGECMGDSFIAFDLLELKGANYRQLQLRDRISVLANLVPKQGAIRLAETTTHTMHKAGMLQRLREANAEGAVFKKRTSLYAPGRPASGGDALKLKFCETASFIVSGINDQRSVSLALYRGSELVPAGNVTIPANQLVPKIGAIVEVRYLYAFPESGCVYQPVFLGTRDDVPTTDCLTTQLKYRSVKEAA